ncbi:predicted protein [Lichtheimia corymbifera JMRC:FSU:9682]|uniref:Uncharacterized protein n=1 Tax=Lichtheimia corymbifera JMRC:FSU:9682 TaxID=1263082 RepID=A0A068RJT8_9FUNG|nr:predicted protein [Lichtheimia corymbifera JMRC:FSU:9682]
MSQQKAISPDLRDSKDAREEPADEPPATRILTRRASRSAANSTKQTSEPPPSKGADDGDDSRASTSPTRVTRSQSIEPTDHHQQQQQQQPINTRKRMRRGTGSTSGSNTAINGKKRTKPGNEASERETRNATQRMTKETREARRAQREAEMKERLAELDELEQTVKNGTHPEYLRLLTEIENKREKRIRVTKAQYELALQNQNAVLDTIRKASKDNLVLKKQAFRRHMMQQVQQQISKLEQEYYTHNVTSSLDNQHVANWTPLHRPSRLDSIVVPLTQEDAESDIHLMQTAIEHQQQRLPPSSTKQVSPPPPPSATASSPQQQHQPPQSQQPRHVPQQRQDHSPKSSTRSHPLPSFSSSSSTASPSFSKDSNIASSNPIHRHPQQQHQTSTTNHVASPSPPITSSMPPVDHSYQVHYPGRFIAQERPPTHPSSPAKPLVK